MRFPDDVPALTDGVVTLRAHGPGDTARIVEQCGDPEMAEWTSVPSPYDDAEARDFFERVARGWREETSWSFAVEHEDRFAGTVDLQPHRRGEMEIGFGLHPDARGRGVMARAVCLLLDWAFQDAGLAAVHWRAQEGNWASRRVAWATGFTFGPTVPPPAPPGRSRWTGSLVRGDAYAPTGPWLEPQLIERGPVRLRPWREDDGPRLVAIANDPLFRRALPRSPLPRDVDQVPAYLARVRLSAADGVRLAWCVADSATDVALGNVAVFDLDGAGAAEIGYWSHPEGRGRGVMSAAVDLAAEWALDPAGLGLRRLHLLTAASNLASCRVAERAGFVRGGTERAAAPTADGGWEDNALYDRLARVATSVAGQAKLTRS